jgi:uncharacterized protein DUF6232
MEKTVAAINEAVFYAVGKVRITDQQAIFGDQIYDVANITWVAEEKVDPSGGLSYGILVFGLLLMAYGYVQGDAVHYGAFGIGLILAVAGGYRQKSIRYILKFGDSYGEISRYSSTDEAEINQMAAAMKQVIHQENE